MNEIARAILAGERKSSESWISTLDHNIKRLTTDLGNAQRQRHLHLERIAAIDELIPPDPDQPVRLGDSTNSTTRLAKSTNSEEGAA